MKWELLRHDWSALNAATSTTHLASAILGLIHAPSEEIAKREYDRIDNVVVVQGSVYEAALPIVECLMMGLPIASSFSRPWILNLLSQICSGGPESSQAIQATEDCRRQICQGAFIYFAILENGKQIERLLCSDLLTACCEWDNLLADRVLFYFKRLLEEPDVHSDLAAVVTNNMHEIEQR